MKLSSILLAASICLMPSVGVQAKSKKKDKKKATAAMQQQAPAANSYAKLTSGSKNHRLRTCRQSHVCSATPQCR